jgi:signal transduction histidine kinase
LRRCVADTEAALDLRVQVQPLPGSERDELLLYVTDISSDKRREVLERTFFHDVLNTICGVRGMVELLQQPYLDQTAADGCRQALSDLCTQLVDEVESQRHLLAAEAGNLEIHRRDEPVLNLVADVLKTYRHGELTDRRQLVVDPGPLAVIRTDPVLLRRCLSNLVKNALEATAAGGRVNLGWRLRGGRVEFYVHNDALLNDEVQRQIFQRSFTTKPGLGRGIGAYSVKLFVEGYLGGQVRFSSGPGQGTVFTISLPL